MDAAEEIVDSSSILLTPRPTFLAGPSEVDGGQQVGERLQSVSAVMYLVSRAVVAQNMATHTDTINLCSGFS